MQRFQGLDRHRPVEALPEVAGTGPFLPPFVGMTPLATDGPRGGSGAGFGRDHAEKWQSGGVSRTTLMVTDITSPASLKCGSQPRGHPHVRPLPHQSLPAQAPSSSASTAHSLPHRTHTIRRTTSLDSSAQHQNKPSLWTRLSGVDQTAGEAPPRMTRRRPPRYCPVLALSPVPMNKIIARDSHPHQHGTPRPPQ